MYSTCLVCKYICTYLCVYIVRSVLHTNVLTSDRHIEKEDLAKYVCRKREMFLVQYSLGVKREEIRKLEEIARVSVHVKCPILWLQ